MRKGIVILAALALMGCVAPRRSAGQFIGYTSPQTVQQTLSTNTTCSGAAQTYAISNLGQTQHYLSVGSVVNAKTFQAEIDGVDTQGNVYRISDVLEIAGLSTTRQGTLAAAGYFPKIQVVVTCSPNTATYSSTYSGAWGTFNVGTGSYLTAQIDKINFFTQPANVNQQDNFQTPFGTSAGTIYFQYNTTSVANGTLTVSCNTNGIAAATFPLSATLGNTTALQTFAVPDSPCPFAQVQYTSPGGGTTVTAEYIFAVPGISSHASSDPCESGAIAKSSAPITAAAAATTQIIAATANNSIYVCGYQMAQIATAGTVQWLYGTGASCGTGTVNISAPMGMTASLPITYSGGSGYIFKVPIGNALCLTTTGAGGTVGGFLTLIQAP